jgi:serine/threonine protein phosphatase PrpC
MLRVGVKSDKGKVRQRNEDSYCARNNLFAVADGLGGHLAGEVASKLAISELEKALEANPLPDPQQLEEVFHQANAKICQLSSANPQYRGMGTTLTAAHIWQDRILLGHIGDSRAYLYRAGELCQLTDDHSLSGELFRKGELSLFEAEHHPQRHILTRALGTGHQIDVDTSLLRFGAGDVLLLCTDGLHGKVSEEEMSFILGEEDSPQRTADRLVAAALATGGQDNITVIVVQNGQGELMDHEFSLELDRILEKHAAPLGVV